MTNDLYHGKVRHKHPTFYFFDVLGEGEGSLLFPGLFGLALGVWFGWRRRGKSSRPSGYLLRCSECRKRGRKCEI
jgi:hypothetical protein